MLTFNLPQICYLPLCSVLVYMSVDRVHSNTSPPLKVETSIAFASSPPEYLTKHLPSEGRVKLIRA